MKQNDAKCVKRIVEDENGDLVVAIVKYTWLNCLVRSVYGYICLMFLANVVVLLVTGFWLCATASGVLGIVFGIAAWLNSNDNLQGRIYVELLEDHLLKKKVISDRFISSQFNGYKNIISCITDAGEKRIFEVEFMQENYPTYVVKIHIEGN